MIRLFRTLGTAVLVLVLMGGCFLRSLGVGYHRITIANEGSTSAHFALDIPKMYPQISKQWTLEPGGSQTVKFYRDPDSHQFVEGTEGPDLDMGRFVFEVTVFDRAGGTEVGNGEFEATYENDYVTSTIVWDGSQLDVD